LNDAPGGKINAPEDPQMAGPHGAAILANESLFINRLLKKSSFPGCSKRARCKAPEILRSEAYFAVRRNDLPCQIEFWLGGLLSRNWYRHQFTPKLSFPI
jgi:hypothetical protein